jgi:hypothetical protein
MNWSTDLSSSGTINSGLTIYGPWELIGANPSIKTWEASSTYLLIRNWSKLTDPEVGTGWLSSTTKNGIWEDNILRLTTAAFFTWYTLSSLPSNLNSSPYSIDQGVTIGLNPELAISCWYTVGLL